MTDGHLILFCASFFYLAGSYFFKYPFTILQVLLYAAAIMVLIFPFDIFYFSSRYFFLRTLGRIVFPFQASSLLFGYIVLVSSYGITLQIVEISSIWLIFMICMRGQDI